MELQEVVASIFQTSLPNAIAQRAHGNEDLAATFAQLFRQMFSGSSNQTLLTPFSPLEAVPIAELAPPTERAPQREENQLEAPATAEQWVREQNVTDDLPKQEVRAEVVSTERIAAEQVLEQKTPTPIDTTKGPNVDVEPDTSAAGNGTSQHSGLMLKTPMAQSVERQSYEASLPTAPVPATPLELAQQNQVATSAAVVTRARSERAAGEERSQLMPIAAPLGQYDMPESIVAQPANAPATVTQSHDLGRLQSLMSMVQNIGADGNLSKDGGNGFGGGASRFHQIVAPGFDSTPLSAGQDRAKAANSRLPQAQQAKIIENIQQLLDNALKARDGNTLIVRLDPQELGQLTLKLTQRGEELFARIIPENNDVEQMLRSRIHEITGVLAQSGIKLDNVHVSIGAEVSEADFFNFQQFLQRRQQEEEGSEGGGSREKRPQNHQGDEVVTSPQNASDSAAWIA